MSEQDIKNALENASVVTLDEVASPLPLRREDPPEIPYPVDCLGEELSEPAKAIHRKTDAPLAMCCQSVLAVAALTTQSRANVELSFGADIIRPISEFFITVADSGERKTSVDEEASRGINAYEEELRQAYVDEKMIYDLEIEHYNRRRANILNDRKKAQTCDRDTLKDALRKLGEQPKEPPPPMLTCPEPTIEGLYKMYEKGCSSLGIFSDEGGQMIGGYSMREPLTRVHASAAFSDLWGGKPVKRVRSGDGASVLAHRRLSIHIMVQPQVAALLLGDNLLNDQGILSRCLIVKPKSTAGSRFSCGASEADEKAIKRLARRVLDILRCPQSSSSRGYGELAPRTFKLSKEAVDQLKQFSVEVEVQLADGQRYHPIKPLAGKMVEHATRIAAVMTVFRRHDAETVEIDDVKKAMGLMRYYAEEMLRIRTMSSVDPDIALAEETLRYCQGRKSPLVSLPDVYQYGPHRIGNSDKARKIVNILIKHGWLIPVEGGAEIDGKRRQEVWRVVGHRAEVKTVVETPSS